MGILPRALPGETGPGTVQGERKLLPDRTVTLIRRPSRVPSSCGS